MKINPTDDKHDHFDVSTHLFRFLIAACLVVSLGISADLFLRSFRQHEPAARFYQDVGLGDNFFFPTGHPRRRMLPGHRGIDGRYTPHLIQFDAEPGAYAVQHFYYATHADIQ
ncbi:MAG: hypothetical protein HKM93_11815 [Desulfobacteraceae bacterium]|nr:hypothetical protein [Desulfobacteraceae bacterium]